MPDRAGSHGRQASFFLKNAGYTMKMNTSTAPAASTTEITTGSATHAYDRPLSTPTPAVLTNTKS